MSIGLRRQVEAWDHARPHVRALLATAKLHGRIVDLESMSMDQRGEINARWIVFIAARPDEHFLLDSDGWMQWSELADVQPSFELRRTAHRVRLDERTWPQIIQHFFAPSTISAMTQHA